MGEPVLSTVSARPRALNRILSCVVVALVAMTPLAGVIGLAAPAQAADGTVSEVASVSVALNTSTHSVKLPAGLQAGDTMVLFLTTNSTTSTVNDAVSGWTLLQSADGDGIRGRAWTKQVTSSDATNRPTVSVTTSAAAKSVLSLTAYRSSVGTSRVSDSAKAVDNTAGTSHSAPSVPVAADGSWVVSSWAAKTSAAFTWNTPTGTTSRSTAQGTGSGLVGGVVADSNAPVATGSAPARVATTSASVSRSVEFSVVVAPGSTVDNVAPVARFTSNCPELTCTFNASTSSDANAGDTLTYSWAFGDGTTGTGVTPSHTYAAAGARTVTLTVSDGKETAQVSQTANPKAAADAGTTAPPGHTRIAPQTPRTNMPLITTGEITDFAVVGTKAYVAGGFTSARNQAAGNTTTVNQANLLKFDLDTGLIDTTFRPTFGGGGVQDVEASPDGTKLFVAGRFNTVNGVTKRKFASLDPSTGAPVAGFTADANGAGTEVAASNTTVYLGGQFTTINGTAKNSLAAVNSTTGALVGRSAANPQGTFTNNITGGIGPNGALNVQELKLTHDGTKLLVVHTGRQIAGQDRYGVGLIDTKTQQLLPWRSRLWQDNLANVGGIQRIYAGDIAPDDSYAVVSSGSGGDAPPISDTVISLPLTDTSNTDVKESWISRAFDSVYSVAATEKGVYIGGHFSWNESPTANDPWPGLTNVGYGTGQGLSGYGLGDQVVRRDHIGLLSASEGKALEFDPGSNSFEGNKAMLAIPRGILAGGDATTQGGYNVGRVAFYDFNSETLNTPNDTTITSPIEGRVEPAATQFTVEGTAKATTGVKQVQLEVIDGSRYLQDDLTTWGAANTINVNLASPNATTTNWSLPLTIAGNRALKLQAKTFAVNGSSDATKAVKKIETFSTSDKTPTASISSPGFGTVPSTTFTIGGTATDDLGVQSLSYTLRDANGRYLQDDGTTSATYNAFRLAPDVVGAPSTTWSTEVTVPYEGQWKLQVTPSDTSGQSSLDTIDRTFIVSSTGIAPTVTISKPVVMNPPTAANPITVAPGSPMTFSGTASDDQNLDLVSVTLRNNTTREVLASDGTWGTNVQAGSYRVTPLNLNATTTNWTYTTPFNLSPGSYSFSVSATDDEGLTTTSANRGTLTINVQVANDAPPNGLLNTTGTVTGLQSLHLDLAGTATDDVGVASVGVTLQERDTNRYLQPDGTMGAGFATLKANLASPGATSTTWTLPVDLPVQGNWSVTAYATDTAGQTDTSTTGATASYPIYPGDQAPTVTQNLLAPTNGTVFTDGRIFISGRVEDDQAIARAQVAVVDSSGHYLTSGGTFGTTTTETWINAFLNSVGSPGSNYSYTTQVVPAGTYTVRVRGVDQHGFTTSPTTDVTVTVQVPASNPPVASFSVVCGPAVATGIRSNTCEFDGRGSTDENPTTLTYAWNFGTTPASTGTGAVVRKTFTTAGTYTVSLTAKDEYGNLSAPVTQTVTIAEPTDNVAPTAVISDPACTGLVCNFSSASSADANVGDTLTRVWNWGDGTANSTTTSLSHTFPAAGIYTVSLTVTDGWGKATTTTRQVTVTSP